MYLDCEAYGLKKHRLTRSDCIVLLYTTSNNSKKKKDIGLDFLN